MLRNIKIDIKNNQWISQLTTWLSDYCKWIAEDIHPDSLEDNIEIARDILSLTQAIKKISYTPSLFIIKETLEEIRINEKTIDYVIQQLEEDA